jgi:hypothetical protein
MPNLTTVLEKHKYEQLISKLLVRRGRAWLGGILIVIAVWVLFANGIEMIDNPQLGRNAIERREEIAQTYGNCDPCGRSSAINLELGSGARFLRFISEQTPEDIHIILPAAQLDGARRAEVFGVISGPGAYRVTLYPRSYESLEYDYATPPDALFVVPDPIVQTYAIYGIEYLLLLDSRDDVSIYRVYIIDTPASDSQTGVQQRIFALLPEPAESAFR